MNYKGRLVCTVRKKNVPLGDFYGSTSQKSTRRSFGGKKGRVIVQAKGIGSLSTLGRTVLTRKHTQNSPRKRMPACIKITTQMAESSRKHTIPNLSNRQTLFFFLQETLHNDEKNVRAKRYNSPKEQQETKK